MDPMFELVQAARLREEALATFDDLAAMHAAESVLD
jgi:hypothetical protein